MFRVKALETKDRIVALEAGILSECPAISICLILRAHWPPGAWHFGRGLRILGTFPRLRPNCLPVLGYWLRRHELEGVVRSAGKPAPVSRPRELSPGTMMRARSPFQAPSPAHPAAARIFTRARSASKPPRMWKQHSPRSCLVPGSGRGTRCERFGFGEEARDVWNPPDPRCRPPQTVCASRHARGRRGALLRIAKNRVQARSVSMSSGIKTWAWKNSQVTMQSPAGPSGQLNKLQGREF